MTKALITGITGQDGSYLAELLLGKGYEVHGIFRRCSTFNTDRIEHLYVDAHNPDARLFLHAGDVADGTGLRHIIEKVRPDEVYNLAAQSHVRISLAVASAVAAVRPDECYHLAAQTFVNGEDWGFAGDYVKAMWLMLQQEKPDDYVVATGERAFDNTDERIGNIARSRSAPAGGGELPSVSGRIERNVWRYRSISAR